MSVRWGKERLFGLTQAGERAKWINWKRPHQHLRSEIVVLNTGHHACTRRPMQDAGLSKTVSRTFFSFSFSLSFSALPTGDGTGSSRRLPGDALAMSSSF